ncbi:hypothetical protein ACFLT9_06635 [Acidobacteriota bacterium]
MKRRNLVIILCAISLQLSMNTYPHFGQASTPNSTTKRGSSVILNQQQEEIDQQAEELKKAVKERANKILAIDPCDATLDEWHRAGKIAADAFQLGQEAIADDLMEWIKITFRALVAKDIDAIMESTLMEKLKRGEGEELLVHGKLQGEIKRSEEIMRTRGDLAAQAQYLGYDQLADDILAGRFIQSPCIQLWDIVVTLDLKSTPESWLLDSWKSQVVFKEVPLYFWDPELGYPPLFRSEFAKGTLSGSRFGWYDGGDWIKGSAQGEPVWEIEIFQWIEDQRNYNDSPFIVSFKYAPFHIVDKETLSGLKTEHTLTSGQKLRTQRFETDDMDGITAYPELIQISGQVTVSSDTDDDIQRTGISGVVLNGLPDNPVTDEEGNYSVEVESGWSGDVIPYKSGYFFSPSYREYSEVSEDFPDQDYVAVTRSPASTKRPRISSDYTPNVIIKYSDGEVTTLDRMSNFDINLRNDTEIRIPHEKLQKGKPFTIEVTNEDANYVGVAKFEFIPIRQLKSKEKRSR